MSDHLEQQITADLLAMCEDLHKALDALDDAVEEWVLGRKEARDALER